MTETMPAPAPTPPGDRPALLGLGRPALATLLAGLGLPERAVRMRVSQLWHALYVRGARDLSELTTLPKDLRTVLEGTVRLARPEIAGEQISEDGTRKWLLRLAGGALVETVFIPEEARGTLCISSQVGCTLTCRFCHTGTQGLVRNLTPDEILGQVLLARDRLGDWPAPGTRGGARRITNVVLMGMGEPLYNFENVRDAMLVCADGEGVGLGRRRITLSTSGVVPQIPRWGAETNTSLAISLHAVRDELRDELVPLNRKYPIAELLAAVRAYPALSNARRVTFEYVMLKGVNDSAADARALVKLIAGIPAKINLIPFNPWPGSPYECSDWETIESFAEIVNRAGYASPVRTPRGRDILAACGQLRSETVKQRASERRRLEGEAATG
ncbi:MAG: 23S rRNA (adenine(2503)-C(2))-methyltransferase RlmN [Alphaproteobacteria bacterium]|nr:23S rRNA (adenine(2503)-C(2))-methyltransferase RlmN [Alphaproteobacteria bacterium]